MKWIAAMSAALILPLVVASAQTELTDRTLDVGGLALHIRCGGDRRPGAPLVVLEAGAGNSADTWRDVHRPIAGFVRACAYDRPGTGSSAKPREPLSADAYVQLLGNLLKAAREPGPYVLVGHSIGGVIAALFANVHQADVSGMVLVDSSHEDQIRRFRALAASSPSTAPAPPPPALPEPIPVPALIDALSNKPWRAAIPLVVLTRGRTQPSTDPIAEARNNIWLELQRDWATRSPLAKQIVAANSGHYIHNDEPALVIAAVREVVNRPR